MWFVLGAGNNAMVVTILMACALFSVFWQKLGDFLKQFNRLSSFWSSFLVIYCTGRYKQSGVTRACEPDVVLQRRTCVQVVVVSLINFYCCAPFCDYSLKVSLGARRAFASEMH